MQLSMAERTSNIICRRDFLFWTTESTPAGRLADWRRRASSASGMARRVLASAWGLRTPRSGLVSGVIHPSFSAC